MRHTIKVLNRDPFTGRGAWVAILKDKRRIVTAPSFKTEQGRDRWVTFMAQKYSAKVVRL